MPKADRCVAQCNLHYGRYVKLYSDPCTMRSSRLCVVSTRCRATYAGRSSHSFRNAPTRTVQLAVEARMRCGRSRYLVGVCYRRNHLWNNQLNRPYQLSTRNATSHSRVLRTGKLCQVEITCSRLFPRELQAICRELQIVSNCA
jgi:hypothetical protein